MNSIIMIVTAALLYCMGVVAVRGAEETPWPVVGCGRVMMVNPGATLSMESGAATYSLNLANTAWFIVPAGEYTVAFGGGTTNVLVDEGQTYYVTGGGAGIPQWYVQPAPPAPLYRARRTARCRRRLAYRPLRLLRLWAD